MGILLANPITTFMGWIMKWIYEILSSIGLESTIYSIIVFTIIIYTLMLPLTIKQQKFTRISAVMNPEIKKLQDKYKGKKDQASMLKQQEEMKLIYAKYGTSPTGGCVSSLIQLPILFALWPVIQNISKYIDEVGDYNRFLFIKDVTEAPTVLFKENMNPMNIGMLIVAASIPVLSGLTQWINMKVSQNVSANANNNNDNEMMNQMNATMKFMPIFSVVMCFSMPIGLGVYWIISAVVRTIQQIVINKILDKKSVNELVEENAKKLEKKNEKKKQVDGKNVNSMAQKYTRRIEEMKEQVYAEAEKKEKAQVKNTSSKPGSLSSKANMVRDYNNKYNQ